MNEKSLPLPLGLCESCQSEAVKSGEYYCEHNHAGCLFINSGDASAWQIYTPVSRETYDFIIASIKFARVSTESPAMATNPQRIGNA